MTWMATVDTAIPPELVMPPTLVEPNSATPVTTMPCRAVIVPALVMPPRKVVTQLQISMPTPDSAVMVPPVVLEILPAKVSTF